MNKKIYAYLAAMVSVGVWSMSYIWSDRLLDQGIPVEYFVPVRMLMAGVLLMIINLLSGKSIKMKRKDLFRFFLLALCMPFIYFIAETYGLQFTDSPTITSLIIAANPLISMLVGMIIFKESFSRLNILGVFITLAGLWVVTYTHSSTGPLFVLGVLILFIAVGSEVTQISLTKSLSDTYDPSVIVMYQFLIGAVFFVPLFLTKGIAKCESWLYFSWSVVYHVLALALLCSATAFTTWAYAIKHLGVARTSVFLAVVPMGTAVLAFLVGDERLSPMQWVGLTVSMVGIYLTQLVAEKKGEGRKAGAESGEEFEGRKAGAESEKGEG